MLHQMSMSFWLLCASLAAVPLTLLYGIPGKIDLILLVVFLFLRIRTLVVQAVQLYNILPILGITGGTVFALWLSHVVRSTNIGVGKDNGNRDDPKPLFFPSRTSHTRLFPKVHSFSYSYLLAGIPVGWQGRVGGMLAADQKNGGVLGVVENHSGIGIFSVNAADYLERGNGRLGLQGKLREYLRSQGVDHTDYPYAYLITAPKFMSYSFNPVSFWYLYSATKELTAMVLEVNNTFDERHMYFLRLSGGSAEVIRSNDEIVTDLPSETETRKDRKTSSMAKEFHVSPFNSRKGSYSVIACDPLYPSMCGHGPVDNTIVLKSSKGHTKLVARIFSEGSPRDPAAMDLWTKGQFLLSWWWVGFVTYPRIVREAGKLFFRRKLHVWFRPEPRKDTIGRHADGTEKALEGTFRAYLKYLVHSSSSSLVVRYHAAGTADALQETFINESAKVNLNAAETLEFTVLTPVFYTRFIHYAHDLEALFCEFHESSTIWLSRPDLIPILVLKRPQPPLTPLKWMNFVGFKAIQKLRRRPEAIQGPKSKDKDGLQSTKSDIRNFRLSALDGFVLYNCTPQEQTAYRTLVLKIFVSDRIAFGSVALLYAEFFILRCWIILVSVEFLCGR